MIGIKIIAQTIHEFQFGAQLEKRQVEIASQTHLGKEIVTFELDVIRLFPAQIYHRCEASHEIGTMVAEPWSGKDDVEGG